MTDVQQNIEKIINAPIPPQIASGTDPYVINQEVNLFVTNLKAAATAARGFYLTEKPGLEQRATDAENERNKWTTKFPGQTPDAAKTAYDNAQTEANKVPGLQTQLTTANAAKTAAEQNLATYTADHSHTNTEYNTLQTQLTAALANGSNKPNWLARGTAALLLAGTMFGIGRYSKSDSPSIPDPIQQPAPQTATPTPEPYFTTQQWRVKVQLDTPAGDTNWYNETSREALGHEFMRRALHFSPAMLEQNKPSLIILDGVTELEVAHLFERAQRERNTTYTPRQIEQIIHKASGDDTLSHAEITELTHKLDSNQPLE